MPNWLRITLLAGGALLALIFVGFLIENVFSSVLFKFIISTLITTVVLSAIGISLLGTEPDNDTNNDTNLNDVMKMQQKRQNFFIKCGIIIAASLILAIAYKSFQPAISSLSWWQSVLFWISPVILFFIFTAIADKIAPKYVMVVAFTLSALTTTAIISAISDLSLDDSVSQVLHEYRSDDDDDFSYWPDAAPY